MKTVSLTLAYLALFIGSWLALLFRYVQAKRRISPTEVELKALRTERNLHDAGFDVKAAANALQRLAYAGTRVPILISNAEFEALGTPYPDEDGDGVPDAFQRRKPLSEILEFEKAYESHANDYWVAIELPPRSPQKGEYYISAGENIRKAGKNYFNYFDHNAIIIKAVPGTNLDDLVDLTK